MNRGHAIVTALLCLLSAAVTSWLVAPRPGNQAKTAPPPPATVPHVFKEEQVNAITLSAEAVERLALRTAPVERKRMPLTRVYGGEVVIPPGQTILVSAPLSGTLKALPDLMPQVGGTVKKGQSLFLLLPLLTPEGRANLAAAKIDADGQVKTARTQLDASRIALERARRVFESEASSRRSLDEAQANFDLAQKALEAAMARLELLGRVVGEVENGTAAPLVIDSPADGLLRNVSARPGQNVPAGGALFEVADLQRLWARVPVYVGDLAEVDEQADAAIGALTLRPDESRQTAKRAIAPPSANAAAGTVDLYYVLDNAQGRFSPGQRIGVSLPLKAEAESLTVPWSAVVYDIHGGTWVYELAADRSYLRRRVAVRRVAGDQAVLAAGPPPGTRVVSAGAAELFGTETGFTK